MAGIVAMERTESDARSFKEFGAGKGNDRLSLVSAAFQRLTEV